MDEALASVESQSKFTQPYNSMLQLKILFLLHNLYETWEAAGLVLHNFDKAFLFNLDIIFGYFGTMIVIYTYLKQYEA